MLQAYSLLPMSKQIEHSVHKHATLSATNLHLQDAEITSYSAANPFPSSEREKLAPELGQSHDIAMIPAHTLHKTNNNEAQQNMIVVRIWFQARLARSNSLACYTAPHTIGWRCRSFFFQQK